MVIRIQCTDRVGLVASIAGVLSAMDINILSMREHVDTAQNRFFIRLLTAVTGAETDAETLTNQLQLVLPAAAEITVNPSPDKKIILLVTREYHCLSDILIRNHFKTLQASVQCVIGNHNSLQNICERFDVPFHLVSHEAKERDVFEKELAAVINQYEKDYLVLAKFMRILSAPFIAQFPHKIINIHHSFLPAFIGANPYKKAYERGVKIIGATAHFVNELLDEGPIIAQSVIPVDHTHDAREMAQYGRDVEKNVLAHALRLVCNERVFVFKNKTIIFD